MREQNILPALCTLAAGRLSLYLADERRDDLFAAYADIIDPEITTRDVMVAQRALTMIDAPQGLALWSSLHGAVSCLLELAVFAASDTRAAQLVARAQHTDKPGVSLRFAAQVLGADAMWAGLVLEDEAWEIARRLFVREPDRLVRARGYERFSADERLLDHLCGRTNVDHTLAQIVRRDTGDRHEPYIAHEVIDAVDRALDDGVTLIQVTGAAGSGRRFAVRTACRRLERALLLVDGRQLLREPEETLDDLLWRVAREAAFARAVLCLYDIEGDEPERPESGARKKRRFADLAAVLRDLAEHADTPVCVCTSPELELIPSSGAYIERVDIPVPGRGERIELWERFCEQYSLYGVDCRAFGSKFRLSPAEIHAAVARLSQQAERGATIDDARVTRACYDVQPAPSAGNIKLVRADYTLDDLKVTPEQRTLLQKLCAHVRHRHLVYDTWGIERKYPYGNGVSALFTGPPGTGKTMAAHVIAGMLGLELYRVDLSQVVDKYIGETEKRLEEIFDAAQKSNFILFFDEADAIFGKRSEVSDAKDRYANTEVSYILQRIEDYDGIVILATNYKHNIDEAFMRRIRYLIDFPLPSPAIRKEIWESALPAEVPREPLDFGYLAEQFELSGGGIKNILLNAVFHAADEQSPLTMRHILESTRGEMLKNGRTMLKQDFGAWAHVLEL